MWLLENQLAHRFDRTKEHAFNNGNGINSPTVIITATEGVKIGVTASKVINITFDKVLSLKLN
jgi:HK97 family phage major capsid protein